MRSGNDFTIGHVYPTITVTIKAPDDADAQVGIGTDDAQKIGFLCVADAGGY
jgi:hypothetical protein